MFNNNHLTLELPKLEKFAMRLTRNRDDAKDLVQSAVLRAIEKKNLFQENTDLFKWTSKIMYNLFVTGYHRKAKFETKYDPEIYLELAYVDAPQDNFVEIMKVNEAMRLLSPDQRNILLSVCVFGMSYEEAAKKLNIPVGTVRSRLSRAREQLQDLLNTPSEKKLYSFPIMAGNSYSQVSNVA